jgi:hypothetical protein
MFQAFCHKIPGKCEKSVDTPCFTTVCVCKYTYSVLRVSSVLNGNNYDVAWDVETVTCYLVHFLRDTRYSSWCLLLENWRISVRQVSTAIFQHSSKIAPTKSQAMVYRWQVLTSQNVLSEFSMRKITNWRYFLQVSISPKIPLSHHPINPMMLISW